MEGAFFILTMFVLVMSVLQAVHIDFWTAYFISGVVTFGTVYIASHKNWR